MDYGPTRHSALGTRHSALAISPRFPNRCISVAGGGRPTMVVRGVCVRIDARRHLALCATWLRRRRGDRRVAIEVAEGISGSLHETALTDFLRILAWNGRSGAL